MRSIALFPCCPCPDILGQESHSLVVRRVEPEHPVKDTLSLVKTSQAPQAQPVAAHASQKRAVVDVTPQEHAVETIAEGQFSDTKADLYLR